jgi:putative nucleotidyltransferase with HDIG domain
VRALEVAFWTAAGWTAVAAGIQVLVCLPLARIAGQADALSESLARALPREREDDVGAPARPAPPSSRLPSLHDAGYPGIVLERLVTHARATLGVEEACLFVRDRRNPERAAVLVAAAGVDTDLIGQRLPIGRGLPTIAMGSRRPVVVPDREPPSAALADGGEGEARGVAWAPVALGSRTHGALSIAPLNDGLGVGLRELSLLGELAKLAAQALEHHERRELADADPQAEIEGLLRSLELADLATRRHAAQVEEAVRSLADNLSLAEPDRLELALAALLHDVGKLRVPQRILHKPGSLTDAEWEVMRLHSVWGAEIVGRIPGLQAVALIVRHHHERFDGRGYPDGLSGDRIPLASRVVALCDGFAAMTSNRPYRSALEPDEALYEVHAGAGGQFDPAVSARFTRVVRGDPAPPRPAPAGLSFGDPPR